MNNEYGKCFCTLCGKECVFENQSFVIKDENGAYHWQHKSCWEKAQQESKNEKVDHPSHYGGADNPYEAIKVIEAWKLGFNIGNAVKYISRAGKKDDIIQDLKKAAWYLAREIQNLKGVE